METSRFSVLCVDDDEAVRRVVTYLLSGRHAVVTAASGEEALSLLASRDDICLLVADQRLRGMSGVELCERAVALRPDILRCVITAYRDINTVAAAVNRGQVHRYLPKPLDPVEFGQLADAAVERAREIGSRRAIESDLLWRGPDTVVRTVGRVIAHEVGAWLGPLVLHAEEIVRDARVELVDAEDHAARLRRIEEHAAAVAEGLRIIGRILERSRSGTHHGDRRRHRRPGADRRRRLRPRDSAGGPRAALHSRFQQEGR
jgi:CheY-like chemotaxis protein